MNAITKVSDITASDVWDYLRPSDSLDTDNANFINTTLNVAKKFISTYTGRPLTELDSFEDLVIVVFVLCQDMYDNRTLYVDKSNLNNVVESILFSHSVNLL